MKPVTTTMRIPNRAMALGAIGLAICIVALIMDTNRVIAVGFSLGGLFLLAAILAHAFAPKRTVVLLAVEGGELQVTSRMNPGWIQFGRLYRESQSVPIASIRELVSREIYLGHELGHFVDVSLTRPDGTTETLLFPGELRDQVNAFLRQLQESRPNIEFVDDGYHTRVTWWSWKSLVSPREP